MATIRARLFDLIDAVTDEQWTEATRECMQDPDNPAAILAETSAKGAARRSSVIAGTLEEDFVQLLAHSRGALSWMATIINATDKDGHTALTLDLAGLRQSYKVLNDAIVKFRE